MGGKEASRGFLYQGFASVLEALTDKSNWDKIYVEFPTSNDKVDIALEQQNQIVKCIQVKSTINTFTKSDIKTWLDDLIKDIESPEYELFLIGQCDKSANTFIKSIEKYYGKVLDKEAKSSLNGFDTDLFDNKRIQFLILPFEIEVLEKIVRDSLHQYISDSNQMMAFDQIRFIASATVNDQMISSTHGKGIDRKEFDEEMEKRILLVADKYSSILQNIVSKIRDGKRHLFLIGFPVPRIFGGDPEIISWKALYLPTVSYGKRTARGFRNNQQGWWMRDKCEVFTKNAKLDWIVSENWNQHEISQRGKMSDLLLRKRILLIGAGCIGASIAEIFVRAGVYNITIADSDIFEVGNLSRHILNLNNIGEFKELSVCNYLNSLNPHANVKVINDTLSNDDSFKTNIDLDRYDVIVDCTGENNVLDILQSTNFKRTHIIASVSVGLGAKRLYVTLMNGNTFNFNAFYDLISPYLQAEKVLYDDYDLPRNGIGCWHPTFPGRSDDIWIAAATSVKVIENYIISKSQKTLSFIYEQKESDGIFESYEVVEKREDG